MIRLFRRRPATSTASVVYAVPGAVGVLGLRDGELAPEAAERLARELRLASVAARKLAGKRRMMMPGTMALDVEKGPSVTEQILADPAAYWAKALREVDQILAERNPR